MNRIITLVWWRMTGYRELSKLLHAHFGHYDALMPVGLRRMEQLAAMESVILPIGREKHWIERYLF